MAKKNSPNTRTKDRKFKERRKGARTVHTIDKNTTPREFELAKSDLTNFFLDVAEKHHGGW